MSVILLIVGIVVTGAGLAALGFGIPINEFSLGTTLITAGTTGLCGGLILIGLSAAVAELRRVGDLLKARPLGQPARKTEAPSAAAQAIQPPAVPVAPAGISPAAPPPPALPPFTQAPAPAGYAPAPSLPANAPAAGPPAGVRHAPPQRPRPEMPAHDLRRAEPQPAPASSMDVSAGAIERLRSSIPRTERGRPEPAMVPEGEEVPLSPNGGHQAAPARRASLEPALEPRLTPADRLGGAGGEAPKSSRLDFLFRARQATQQRAESFDPGRPAETQYSRAAPPEMQPRYPETTRAPAPPLPAPPPAAAHPAAPTVDTRPHEPAPATEQPAGILKSGVVDGMAYTLYSDGSIEAKLPDGTVRFGSIAELRAHIEKHP